MPEKIIRLEVVSHARIDWSSAILKTSLIGTLKFNWTGFSLGEICAHIEIRSLRKVIGILDRHTDIRQICTGRGSWIIRNNNSLKTPLRLGVVESVAKNLSAFIIKEMKSRCSKVTVLTGISSYLLKLLDDDILDVIICPDPFSNRNDLKSKLGWKNT